MPVPDNDWATMNDTVETLQQRIEAALRPLIGLSLSIVRNAGSMINLQFGEPARYEGRLAGQYALHVQCPWRLTSETSLITGTHDFYHPADDNLDDEWQAGSPFGHLQDQLLQNTFSGCEKEEKSLFVPAGAAVVQAVSADQYGGFELRLSGGYRLSAFPAAARGEHWRLLRPGNPAPHFVVGDGAISLE